MCPCTCERACLCMWVPCSSPARAGELLVRAQSVTESARDTDPSPPANRTCHRISTEVVVWGVTDTMVGASSGAGGERRTGELWGAGWGPLGGRGNRVQLTLVPLQAQSTPTARPNSCTRRDSVDGGRGRDPDPSRDPGVEPLLSAPRATGLPTLTRLPGLGREFGGQRT